MYENYAINEEGKQYICIHFVCYIPDDPLAPNLPSPHEVPRSEWRLACAPNKDLNAPTLGLYALQRTDDPRAVTCPSCLRTPRYAMAIAALQACHGKVSER